MPKLTVTCHHTEWWTSEYMPECPPPAEATTCDCGQNWTCPVCGFGQGQYPCDCNRERVTYYIDSATHKELLERGLEEYADIWRALAATKGGDAR